jgi:hypothetical protein
MALSYDILVRVGGGLAAVYLLLSLFNVHWLTRVRTLAALLIGVVLVGWVGWPLVRPEDPLGAICLVDNMVNPGELLILCGLAFASGLAAYLASWPKGSTTAPLAAPAGLAVWVFASGDMRSLLLTNSTVVERQKVYAILCWEGLFWLILVAAGLLGVLVGWRIQNRGKQVDSPRKLTVGVNPGNVLIAALVSGVLVWFLIGILAQDVRQPDAKLGYVIGQPGKGQIAFAVCISFLAAGYATTHFFKISYIIPMVCAAGIVFIAMRYAASPATLEQMTQYWPVAYVFRSICGILPIQMVAFGTLGAFAGCQFAQKSQETPKQA